MVSRFEGEIVAYRIVREGLPAFDGGGSFRWGGRWTHPGRYIIHATESYALAVLEAMAHFNIGELPPFLVALRLRIPAAVSREVLDAKKLPGWQAPPPHSASRSFGDRWYDERRSAIAFVPSVLSPFESNILINQNHPHTRLIEIEDPISAKFDERLQKLLRGER